MKKVVLISSVLLIFIIGVYAYYYSDKQKYVLLDEISNQVINTNSLTLMYETEYQSGEYQVSSDSVWPQSGYTFNEELSKCENGSTLIWNDESKQVLMQANTSDKCYVYFDKEPLLSDLCFGKSLSECITTQVYTGTDGVSGVYKHDGQGIYTNADQETGDNSYRYAGANPNNYVCFGSDEAVCLNNDLYRIIGVFDNHVKLIKLTSFGSYAWDGTNSDYDNTWNETTKPDIYTTLNETYYNRFGSEWQDLIVETVWHVNGIRSSNGNVLPKKVYTYEIGEEQSGYEETMKIGLMYVSEYGYAASPENWTTPLYDYDNDTNRNNNWMFFNPERTISRVLDDSKFAFVVAYNGKISDSFIYSGVQGFTGGVRPTFYLNSDAQYISGTGTQTDPYRIA